MNQLEQDLTSRLPLVEMKVGLPLVERAEFSLVTNSSISHVCYVSGYCRVDEGYALLYGDSILDDQVYNSSSLAKILAVPICKIDKYDVLSRTEKIEN